MQTVSFSILLNRIAEVPLQSTGAAKRPIQSKRELTPSQEDSLKEKQERKQRIVIHPQSSPKSFRPESLHVQRQINWKAFINNLGIC